jgi:hypothetical protein
MVPDTRSDPELFAYYGYGSVNTDPDTLLNFGLGSAFGSGAEIIIFQTENDVARKD